MQEEATSGGRSTAAAVSAMTRSQCGAAARFGSARHLPHSSTPARGRSDLSKGRDSFPRQDLAADRRLDHHLEVLTVNLLLQLLRQSAGATLSLAAVADGAQSCNEGRREKITTAQRQTTRGMRTHSWWRNELAIELPAGLSRHPAACVRVFAPSTGSPLSLSSSLTTSASS